MNNKTSPQEISPKQLFEALQNKNVAVLDVRESEELEYSFIPDSTHIPLMSLHEKLDVWSKKVEEAEIAVVICRGGVRSQMAIDLLEQNGIHGCLNLVGGINAFAEQTDSGIETY